MQRGTCKMRKQLIKTKNQSGFTIIEVLIVLAIAGLILLIVFLAVPNLQRNSRNTQRKNDVQAILGAISEYESNNAGSLPTTYNNGVITGTGSVSSNVKMGYYTGIADGSGFATGRQSAVTTDVVNIVTGAQCDPAVPGGTIVGSARQIAIQYEIEGGSGFVPSCQTS